MSFHNSRIILLIVTIVSVVAVTASAQDLEPSSIVANVNGEAIEYQEFIDELIRREGQATLNVLIREKIVDQAIQKEGVDIPEDAIQQEIMQIRSQFPSDDEYQRALMASGYTASSLREELELELSLRALVSDEITVTEEEVQQTYELYKDQLGDVPYASAREDLIRTLEQNKLNAAIQEWLTQQIERSQIETFLNRTE